MKKILYILLFLLSANIFAQDISSGLIHYYKLDESLGTVIDAEGGNNGTATGVTAGSTGILNTAYYYDGNSDYITLTSDIILSDASYSFWINIESIPDDIIIMGDDPFQSRIFIGSGNNIKYETDQNGQEAGFFYSFSLSTWYHVVLVRDGNDVLFYRNGTYIATETLPSLPADDLTVSQIGLVNRSFRGTIDEVGIYNRAITSTEVSLLYGSGTPPSYPFTTSDPVVSAGGDQNIYNDLSTYTFSSASAENTDSVIWSTDGTGYFNDSKVTNAVYNTTSADSAAGSRVFKIIGYGNSTSDTSTMTLTFIDRPQNIGGYSSTYVLAVNQKLFMSESCKNGFIIGTWKKNYSWLMGNETVTTTFALVDDYDGAFAIGSSTGVVTVADSSKINGHVTAQDTIVKLPVSSTCDSTGINEIDTLEIWIKEASYSVFYKVGATGNGTLDNEYGDLGDEGGTDEGYGYFFNRGDIITGVDESFDGLKNTYYHPTVYASYGENENKPRFTGDGVSGAYCFQGGTWNDSVTDAAYNIVFCEILIRNYGGMSIQTERLTDSVYIYNVDSWNNDRNDVSSGMGFNYVNVGRVDSVRPTTFLVQGCTFDSTSMGSNYDPSPSSWEYSFIKTDVRCEVLNCRFGPFINDYYENGTHAVRYSDGKGGSIKHCLFLTDYSIASTATNQIQMKQSHCTIEDNVIIGEMGAAMYIANPTLTDAYHMYPDSLIFKNNYVANQVVTGIKWYPVNSLQYPSTGSIFESNIFDMSIGETAFELRLTTNNIIRYNEIFGGSSSGIYDMNYENTGLEIYYNSIYGFTSNEIELTNITNVNISNNTIDGEIYLTGSSGDSVRSNYLKSFTTPDYSSGNLDIDTINTSLHFTDYANNDYSLRETAYSAIDQAFDWGQTQDIIGTSKYGSEWDIGAYELSGPSAPTSNDFDTININFTSAGNLAGTGWTDVISHNQYDSIQITAADDTLTTFYLVTLQDSLGVSSTEGNEPLNFTAPVNAYFYNLFWGGLDSQLWGINGFPAGYYNFRVYGSKTGSVQDLDVYFRVGTDSVGYDAADNELVYSLESVYHPGGQLQMIFNHTTDGSHLNFISIEKTTAPVTTPTTAPIAHYLFENNGNDEMGNYDGTLQGTATYEPLSPPTPEGSYCLDVSATNNNGFLMGDVSLNDTFTICTWIYDARVSGTEALYGNFAGAGVGGLFVYMDNNSGSTSFSISTDDGTGATYTNSNYLGDLRHTWLHLVTIVEGGSASIYVNGSLSNSGSADPDSPLSGNFIIGNNYLYNYTSAAHFDDFQLYDYALSASEINYIMNNPGSTAGDTPTSEIIYPFKFGFKIDPIGGQNYIISGE